MRGTLLLHHHHHIFSISRQALRFKNQGSRFQFRHQLGTNSSVCKYVSVSHHIMSSVFRSSSTKIIMNKTKATTLPNTSARILSACLILDLILVLCFRKVIPRRDFAACRVGLLLVLSLSLFESNDPYNRPKSKRFRMLFTTLSTLEVLLTIVVPWLSLLENLIHRNAMHGHLLASHLLIFQTQIALECIIIMAGENRRWILFPFTLLANCYRLLSILTWIVRTLNETNLESRDVLLPAIAFILWTYSTFIFLPREWYPLIIKTKTGKENKHS